MYWRIHRWMDGWMDRLTDGPTNRLIDRQTNGYFRITSTPVIDLFSSKANTDDGRGHRICTFPGQNILIIALELRKYTYRKKEMLDSIHSQKCLRWRIGIKSRRIIRNNELKTTRHRMLKGLNTKVINKIKMQKFCRFITQLERFDHCYCWF